jgi:predicted ATPase/RsiW-degrading membrane proteinase PrsW (M82 family)
MIAIFSEPGFYLTFAVVQAILVLLVIWALDLYERQPLLLVMLMAFWGGTGAAVIALAGNRAVKGLLSGEAQTVFGDAISAPVVEECAKGLALIAAIGPIRWLAKRFGVTIFEGLTAGIVYGAAVGIGFAFTEDFFYLLNQARTEGVEAGLNLFVYRRDFFGPAVLHHPLFTAAFGAGLGLAAWTTRRWAQIAFPLLGLAVAIAMHAANNGLVEAVLSLAYGLNEAALWMNGAPVPDNVENTGVAMEAILRFLDYVYIAAFLTAAVLWLRYQRRIIRAELAEETATGLLRPGELREFTDPSSRTARYWRLLRSGQLEQWRHRRRLHSALARLALLKWRVKRFGGDEQGVQRARREIATLATYEPHVSKLPEPPTPILGRDRELAALIELLGQEDVRIVTLLGPGGTGKTRLSIELATRLSELYASGAFFCPVATISDRDEAVSAIAKTLEVRDQPGEPMLETLEDHLRDKHLLLVLDNAEQVLEVGPALAELLAKAPRLKVIVTSREALRIRGERAYPVPPLDQRDAVDLFVARARAVDPGFELTETVSPTIEWICRRLDGLPLAIELAAARAKLFAPAEIRDRLEGSLFEATGLGARDLPDRHQTLRATVEWSHGMLGSAEASLFARLGVFAGGFDLDGVESVCEDEGEAISALESLVDKSLVRRDRQVEEHARFEMLQTIREFALERLSESADPDAVRRMHARFFLNVAEAGESELRGPQQVSWVQRLGREHENFRAALQWSRERDGELGLRLAFALARFWEQRGTLGEARTWLAAALDSHDDVDPAVRARGLSYLGRLALLQGDYVTARSLLEQGLAEGRVIDDRDEIAACLLELGWVELVMGSYERSRKLLEEGLDVSRALHDDQVISRALRSLGRVLAERGNTAGARPLLDESLAMRRRLEDRRSISNSLSAIGRASLLAGDLEGARRALEESISLARELGDKLRLAEPLYFLALVAEAESNVEEAATLTGERLELCRELGDRLGIAECLDAIGRSNGDVRLLGAADTIRRSLGAAMWPHELALRNEVEAASRTRLGDAAYERALDEGKTMSIDQAVESISEREERFVGVPL